MELSKKTTILFPPRLYQHLSEIARRRKTSVGELIRAACRAQYGEISEDDRLRAVQMLADLSLPVGTPQEMALEAVSRPEDLLP